jgi:GT2 family glycosyltransferase
MMKVKADVMSPLNPGDKRQRGITQPESGYKNGRHFSGWCFVMKRTVWKKIGWFNEEFPFWCADDIVVEQLKNIGIKPTLVPKSVVKHMPSSTLKTLEKNKQEELTRHQLKKFRKKHWPKLISIFL